MDKRLRNKVALIAGADAIGLAAAKRFEAEGAEVIVRAGDPIDEASVAKFFATLGRKHGRLDILLLNAAAMAVSDLGLALHYAIPILSPGAAIIVSESASSAALRAIMHDAARELAGRNVRVHGISLSASPKSAEDVASAAAFLASRETSFLVSEMAPA
jgi:NAD(P)-dependent dehydrogenase (short-subunit alcohol dehydrogenase family)